MRSSISALFAGGLFGAGLVVSQMADPLKVLAFLDVAGKWDPSLMFVMGGGLFTAFVGYKLILRRSAPLFADGFSVPTNQVIDARLILGASLFGIGWGLAGYCPGPAIAATVTLGSEPLLFVLAMTGGFVAHDLVSKTWTS